MRDIDKIKGASKGETITISEKNVSLRQGGRATILKVGTELTCIEASSDRLIFEDKNGTRYWTRP